MTHISEREFEDYVVEELNALYGAENVHRQFHFESGRRADIVVETALATFCFELENDSGSVVNGSGQARYYASEFDDGVGVLCIPTNHIDDEEREYISDSSIILKEYDI